MEFAYSKSNPVKTALISTLSYYTKMYFLNFYPHGNHDQAYCCMQCTVIKECHLVYSSTIEMCTIERQIVREWSVLAEVGWFNFLL